MSYRKAVMRIPEPHLLVQGDRISWEEEQPGLGDPKGNGVCHANPGYHKSERRRVIERTESGYMAFTDNALEFQKRCAFKDGIEMEKVTEQKYIEPQGGYSVVTGGETEKSEFP